MTAVAICRGDEETANSADDLQPAYPINVAVDGNVVYAVDLDLPGVWSLEGTERQLFVQGSKQLRERLNRPRSVTIHPTGGILVGDSATREIYHIAAEGAEPSPLSDGRIGIPMTLAVAPDEQTLYVGDAETRSVLRLPIAGGDPELVVGVNARGLVFDDAGTLWAVTPDGDAVHRIDVENGTSEAVISGRPYQYPNGLTWFGDHGLVTDGYGSSVWKFTPDGTTELWHQGDPLVGPVGIATDGSSLWVADPKQRQVFQVDPDDKSFQPRL